MGNLTTFYMNGLQKGIKVEMRFYYDCADISVNSSAANITKR